MKKLLGPFLVTGAIVSGALLAGCGDDDGASPVTPLIKSYNTSQAWTCANSTSCQDVFNVHFTSGSVVTFAATNVTGESILQLALYAPGTNLGGTNLFTTTTNELRCNYVDGCDTMPDGQTVTGFVIVGDGTYRLAVTRDWGESCGDSGTYKLSITSDTGFSTPTRTVNDTATQAPGVECP